MSEAVVSSLPTPQPVYGAASKLTIVSLLRKLPWFRGEKGAEPAAPWTNWEVFLKAVYGLPMTDHEHAIYTLFTGRTDEPTTKFREVWGLCGRRARKTSIEALIGAWEGGVEFQRTMSDPRVDPKPVARGERARIPMISKSKDDAVQIKRALTNILNCPGLRHLLEAEATADEVRLTTGCDFTIRAVSLTAGRTRASPCAMLDEVAFWQSDESAQPDVEVIAGIRPAMATFPSPLLVGMSSVYGKTGVVWDTYQDHYRNNGDPVLVWLAKTVDMHDSPQVRKYVQAEIEKDPVAAAAEFESRFRTDIGPFVDPAVVDRATVKGREFVDYNPRRPRNYFAFCDPSGGAQDSFALGIAHIENDEIVVVDYAQEWPVPFDSAEVMDDVASVLHEYHVRHVTGDNVGGIWLRDPLKKGAFGPNHHLAGQPRNIDYILATKPKNTIYREILPRLNAGRIELVDYNVLAQQIKGLQRKIARSGDIIDHRPGAKDDVANAVLGACWLADTLGRGAKDPEEDVAPATTTTELLRRERVRLLEKEQRSGPTRSHGTPRGRMGTIRRRRF